MRVVTTQDLIDGIAERWEFQYWNGGWTHAFAGPKYERLKALVNPTAEDILAVTGNDSWTRLTCDECGLEVSSVAVMGESVGESVSLCSLCLASAIIEISKRGNS